MLLKFQKRGPSALRILNFLQGQRGADPLGDPLISCLCDILLGCGGVSAEMPVGKLLVDVIRFLQKYLEYIWEVCLRHR